MSAEDFNSDPSMGIAFTQSVAEAMGINNNSVSILGVNEVNSTSPSRRLMGGLLRSLSMSVSAPSDSRGGTRRLNAVRLNVNYVVILVMQSLGFQDSDEAVSQLRESIEYSVNTGEFTDILKAVSQSLSLKILENVTSASVAITKVVLAYNSASPTSHPTSQPSLPVSHKSSGSEDALSEGGLIGVIVAALVIFLLLVVFGVLHCLSTKKIAPRIIPVQNTGVNPNFDSVRDVVDPSGAVQEL